MTYAQPSTGGDQFNLKEHGDEWLGSLIVIWPTEVKPSFDTGKYEPTDVVVADIGIIERIDPATGKPLFFKEAFIFSKGLVANTKSRIGQVVLGRLVKRQFAQGVGWSLDPFQPQDIATADAYLATNPRETFVAPATPTPPPAHDPWAGVNATPAPPAAVASPTPAAAASTPSAPGGLDPNLIGYLMSKGISNAATLDEATARGIAAVYPDNPFR